MRSLLSKLAQLFPTAQRESEDMHVAAASSERGFEQAPFIPNNELGTLLVAAAADPSVRPVFNRELLREDLFVATPEQPSEVGHRVLEKDEVLSIMNVASSDGLVLPAVFTSEERIAKCFGAGGGYVAIRGEIVLGIVQESGAVLNPASAYAVQWSAADLAAILGRPVRRVVEKET